MQCDLNIGFVANYGLIGRAPKPAPAGACQMVHFGAAPAKEPHVELLPASTGKVEPRNVAPNGSVSRHHY